MPQKHFDFHNAWDMINGMGIGQQICELDVFLRLASADTPVNSENFLLVDSSDGIPSDVKSELDEKISQARTLLSENELIQTLRVCNVRVKISATAFRSE